MAVRIRERRNNTLHQLTRKILSILSSFYKQMRAVGHSGIRLWSSVLNRLGKYWTARKSFRRVDAFSVKLASPLRRGLKVVIILGAGQTSRRGGTREEAR